MEFLNINDIAICTKRQKLDLVNRIGRKLGYEPYYVCIENRFG